MPLLREFAKIDGVLDRLPDETTILLSTRGIGFKVLTGHGASIDTTTPAGKLVFGIFAAR
jgi:DNA invertase Pin-like site-specific DNA recombinase